MNDSLDYYWPALLIAALGLASVYLLLPRVRGSKQAAVGRIVNPSSVGRIDNPSYVFGAMLGALALVLAGWMLIHNEAALPETILFYAFSGLAVLGGGLMLSQRNPVHAALSFALVVLSTCGLFLLLAAPFLMAATIIVYAGAIIVTFLFVIMLAQQAGLASADQRSREPFLASLGGFVLLGALLCVLQKAYDTTSLDALLARIESVAGATSADEIKKVLGDPAKMPVGGKTPALIKEIEITPAFRRFPRNKLDDAALAWNQKPDVARITGMFQEIHEYGKRERANRGTLAAPDDMKISPYSGTPANASGKNKRDLPARNVAGLGRSLFTDYLLPVELAGTLLLVASIGAIAIAGRRTEGLR
jgi:NADH-quinone oxidoreductase subunit J